MSLEIHLHRGAADRGASVSLALLGSIEESIDVQDRVCSTPRLGPRSLYAEGRLDEALERWRSKRPR